MSRSRTERKMLLAVVALLSGAVVASAVGGFTGPLFGLATAPNGDLLIADAGVGIETIRKQRVGRTIPLPRVTDVSPIGRSSIWATTNGQDPATDSGQALYRVSMGKTRLIANLFDFEAANNPDGHDPIESNPFDVQSLGGRNALVVDAAANDLLRVNNQGDVQVIAVFPDELVSTANIKSLAGCPVPPIPDFASYCELPEMIPAQPVPTSVAIGPDGHYYVGELRGFPAPTGASSVWKVAPDASFAVCPSEDCVKVFEGGFTSIIDLAFDRAGKLHVAEMDERSWAAVEIFGDGVGGTINSCDLSALTCEEVATGIPMLTAITFGKNGSLWATRNALVPGGAEVIEIP